MPFDAVSILNFGHSNSIIVLTCIFFMSYDVEHIFICLFVICVSFMRCLLWSLKWPIFKSDYFLIVELLEIFACFGEQSFIKCVFFKCFLLACGLSFHSFDIIFHRAKFFFNKVELIFCFIDLVVNVLYKRSSSYPASSRYFLICFLGVLNLYFTFKPAIYLKLIL